MNSDSVLSNLASGLLGSILGSLVTVYFSYNILKKEKQYYVELEVITDKILNPLFEKLIQINFRRSMKQKTLVDNKMYEEIDTLFLKNTCWLFITNKKLKPLILNIQTYSLKKNDSKLIEQLELLHDTCENLFRKKYN